MMNGLKKYSLVLLSLIIVNLLSAQSADKRYQYPIGLGNAYFGLNIGHIRYPFTVANLEPGFAPSSIEIPHTAVRFILYGYQINKYLSAQVSYMRPVTYARYNNVNGDNVPHNVWMTVGGLTLNADIPLTKKFSLFAEGGLGVVTRRGFKVFDKTAMYDASYAALLAGGALSYHINKKWDLHLSTTWTPSNKRVNQPFTIFYSGGFNYHLQPLSHDKVDRNTKAGYHFPHQVIYASLTSNALGYGVNDAVSKGPVPIFWGGEAHVKTGIGVHYQRNIFHARKVFAFDWGTGIAIWKSRDQQQHFFTLSAYPVMKFTAIRSKAADYFIEYSVAGPTYNSRKIIDGKKTGKHFTFQDFMGIGAYAGRERKLFAGLRIAHFSNGNMFPDNEGVMVPLTLNLGMTLK